MLKLNARERTILGLALTVLGVWTADRYGWSPMWDAWDNLETTVASKRGQLAYDHLLIAEKERIKREYSAFALRGSEGTEGGGTGGLTRLMREIELLARQSGVQIRDIKPYRGAGSASVSLSLESDWDTLARFIYQVQRSAQILQIESARVQGKTDSAARLTSQFIIGKLS